MIVLQILLGLLVLVVLVNLVFGRLPRPPAAGGGVVETDHGPLHYVEAPGEGPPLLFIHGMPGTCREFDLVRAALPGRHTISFDRPGYAWSDGEPLDFGDQVDTLADAADSLGAAGALVVGHSFGALIALGLALRHPTKVSGLLLLAPAAGGSRVPESQLREAEWMLRLQRPPLRQVSDLLFQRLLRRWATHIGARRAYGTERALRPQRRLAESMLGRPNSIRALANDRLIFNDAERIITRNLRRISQPTVILHGEDDTTVRVRNGRRLAEGLPGSELAELAGAGHQLPTANVSAVLGALERLESR